MYYFQVATLVGLPTYVKESKEWTPFTDLSMWWLTFATCASFQKVRPLFLLGSLFNIFVGNEGCYPITIICKELMALMNSVLL